MATRTLGSLTAADLGRAFSANGVRGSLASVRHYRIETGDTPGAYTAAIVKVDSGLGAFHREVCKDSSVSVEVT